MTIVCIFFSQVVSSEEIKLNLICSSGGSGKTFVGGIKKFNERYKGQISVEATTLQYMELHPKEMVQFISKKPVFDIIAVDMGWFAGIQNYLAPLDKFISKSNVDVKERFGDQINTFKHNGVIKGFPVRSGVRLIFYRKDLLRDAGLSPPKTHQDWLRAARKLTQRDSSGEVKVYGSAPKMMRPIDSSVTTMGFVFPQGIRFLKEDFSGPSQSLKSSGFTSTLNFMKKLVDEGLTPNPLAWSYDDSVAAYQTGKLAMSHELSFRVKLIENPKKSKFAGKMGYDVIPENPGNLGPHPQVHVGAGWSFAIDKNVSQKRQEAAFKFINFVTSPEIQRYLAFEFNNSPPVLAVLNDPDYIKKNPASKAIAKANQKAVLTNFPVPENPKLDLAWHEELQAFMLGKQNAETTAQNTYSKIKKILSK